MRHVTAALLVLTLVLAACGDDDDGGVSAGDRSDTTTTTADDTTTTTAATTTTIDDADLPGERVEIFPHEGADLVVVGVEADDVLNVRAGPGVDFDVVVELEPLAEGLVATGHNRDIDDQGFWAQIRVEGTTGWANITFLSHPGDTTDVTSEVVEAHGERPAAPDMEALGRLVAEQRASDEPPSRIVVVDGPSVGDLGEVTIDVIGFGDDSVGGERLHVFGEPDPSGDGFTLRSVEATLLCTRGVSDGLCV